MKNLIFLFFVLMSVSTQASVYKCVKDGKVNYSNDRCNESAIVVNSGSNENITESKCTAMHRGLPSNMKRSGDAELHAIGIYEGPIHRGPDPMANKVNIHVSRSEHPIVLALFNYESVVWNIKADNGALLKEVIINSSDGTQLSGINERIVKVTRQNIGYTAYDKCVFYSAVAPKLQEFSGLDVTSFQGIYRGLEFAVQSLNNKKLQTLDTKETLSEIPSLAQTYFKPYIEDGSPIRPGNCGSNNNNVGWLNRDLGHGVNIEAGIVYEKGKQITATLFFRNRDGKVDLSPNEFKLYGFPNERIFLPSEVRRSIYKPDSETCADGEWVYLKFPVKPEDVQQIALVFPSDGVAKGGYRIKVRPFRFDKIDDSANGTSKPAMLPISASLASNELTAEERMKSCDLKIAITAAEEVVNKTSSLKEPLSLFSAAAVLFQNGKKDDAVFWFYAAQLRTRYQLAFENGDRGQLLTIMMMTIGAPINNYAFQDVSNLNRILDKVIEWDKKTPNPFMEKAKTEAIDKQIEQIYSGLRNLKTKLTKDKVELETTARKAAPGIEQAYSKMGSQPCQKGKQ